MKTLDLESLKRITGGIGPEVLAGAWGAISGMFSGGVNTVVNNQAPVNQGSGKQTIKSK
jgi:lactobin A/cerein 7B family class IIb bacteriocin